MLKETAPIMKNPAHRRHIWDTKMNVNKVLVKDLQNARLSLSALESFARVEYNMDRPKL